MSAGTDVVDVVGVVVGALDEVDEVEVVGADEVDVGGADEVDVPGAVDVEVEGAVEDVGALDVGGGDDVVTVDGPLSLPHASLIVMMNPLNNASTDCTVNSRRVTVSGSSTESMADMAQRFAKQLPLPRRRFAARSSRRPLT